VLKDYKQAVYWYQKAAAQGYAEAQSNLGIAYAFGKGVLKVVLLHTPDQLLFDTNTRLYYHLLTRLYQKHTQSQDWIVLYWKRCVKRL
jgi:TPR repeat protein